MIYVSDIKVYRGVFIEPEKLELINLPEGTTKTRLRFRNDGFAFIWCRGNYGVRCFPLTIDGYTAQPCYEAEQGSNITK